MILPNVCASKMNNMLDLVSDLGGVYDEKAPCLVVTEFEDIDLKAAHKAMMEHGTAKVSVAVFKTFDLRG